MKQIFNSVFSISNSFIYLIIVAFKIFITVFTINQVYESDFPSSFAYCVKDCTSYLQPIENLLNNNSYAPDFRMPGYGIFYLPLYFLFSKSVALNLLVVVQTIIDIAASILFVKMIWLLTKSKSGIFLAFLLYGIGCTITTYNKFILTETITASLTVFSIYNLVKFKFSGKAMHLFLSSLFMVWAYFCRPVFFPLFIFILVYTAYYLYNTHKLQLLIIFLLPFLIIQSSWTLRNYIHHQKIFLLTKSVFYPNYSTAMFASFEFQKTVGDLKDNIFFTDNDFQNRTTKLVNIDTVILPVEIHTPDFNNDSVIELRGYTKIICSNADTITNAQREFYNQLFTEKISRYTNSIKTHHPFLVFVKIPLKRLANCLFKSSGVQFLYIKTFDSLSTIEKGFKLFFVMIYLIALYGSLFFILKTLVNFNNKFNLLIWLCTLYGMLIHPIFIGTLDARYFYVFYPLISISAILFYTSFKLKTKTVND